MLCDCLLFAAAGHAADDVAGAPVTGIPDPSIARNFADNLDPGGHRKALAERGVTYGINYVGEVQGVASGGLKRGTVYIGRLEGFVDLDLEKISGWKGLAMHAHAFQIHGSGLSREHVGNLMTVSYIEALRSTRLSELWLEQKLLDDKLSVRFGQLTADSEFLTTTYGQRFINATFGFPAITGSNLPSGGPAYPLASPGVRVKLDPVKNVTLQVGVYDGDPAGPGPGDPQERNPSGTNFRVHDPAFVIGEVQVRYNQGKDAAGLPGQVKLGGWRHFGRFDDQRFGTDGLSLADPASNGAALRKRGDLGLYGIVEQQLWRLPGDAPEKGIGVFARASASPSDRNLIDAYVDGGIVFTGLVPLRPDDVVSFGGAYARIASHARGLDRDAIALNGAVQPVRSFEALLEANYQAQIAAGWQIDADLQYVWNPGGRVGDPGDPAGGAVRNATVLTLHTLINY